MTAIWRAVTAPDNESERVLRLPRRDPDANDAAAVAWCAEQWPGVTMPPRLVQARALYELHIYRRLVGLIGVGHGKTLIMYLASLVLGAKNAVFMLPPALVKTFEREVAKYQAAGYPVVNYTIVPYSALSQTDASLLLRDIGPDLIVADEAQNLRNRDAGRTRRFVDYMRTAQDTMFVPMTGTFMEGSITDAAHLFGLALREQSPLPAFGAHLTLWSECLDAAGEPVDTSRQYFDTVAMRMLPGASYRAAVHHWLRSTPGVIITTAGAVADLPLHMRAVRLRVPAACRALVKDISENKQSPDGSVVYESPAHVAMAIRHAMCGFWLRWAWPDGVRDEEWLQARRDWAAACRYELEHNCAPGYDTPACVLEATLRRADVRSGLYAAAYAWWQVADRPEPPREAVWVDDFMIRYAVGQPAGTLVWYQSDAVGRALAAAGLEVFGQGTDLRPPARTVAASIRVHGTGTQLQAWSRAVVLEPPAGGAAWEQLIGRMHRPGQAADRVWIDVCTHAVGLDTPTMRAEFQQELKGQPQKLLEALWEADYVCKAE